MATVETVEGLISKLDLLVSLLYRPAGASIFVSIILTQIVKVLALRHVTRMDCVCSACGHVWNQENREKLSKGQIWAVSWLLTAASFPLLCWTMDVPIRSNFLYGLVAGVVSPFAVAIGKKYGVDLDKLTSDAPDTKEIIPPEKPPEAPTS
jgi:hypothetical protein